MPLESLCHMPGFLQVQSCPVGRELPARHVLVGPTLSARHALPRPLRVRILQEAMGPIRGSFAAAWGKTCPDQGDGQRRADMCL